MTVEVTITLLLRDPLTRTYKAILMPRISLVRNTVRSLGAGWTTRHATALTQSDFRVSERELLRTSARTDQGGPFIVQQFMCSLSTLLFCVMGSRGRHSSRSWSALLFGVCGWKRIEVYGRCMFSLRIRFCRVR
jgi:hypothetical protein